MENCNTTSSLYYKFPWKDLQDWKIIAIFAPYSLNKNDMKKDKTISLRIETDFLKQLDAIVHSFTYYNRSVVICNLLWFVMHKLNERELREIIHTWEGDKAKVDRMHLTLTIDKVNENP